MRVLFTGLVGESLPPPYSGIPKRALILARMWREEGHSVGVTFTYKHDHEDDLGAKASYFFEFQKKPDRMAKLGFLFAWTLRNPFLYLRLLTAGISAYGKIRRDVVLYAAYGVFMDSIYREFSPDVIVAETALIKTFYAGVVARIRRIPFVIETYAEVHDRTMQKFSSEKERTRFWNNFFSLCDVVIAPSNYCARGPLEFLPPEKVKMVYATTLDVSLYQDVPESKEQAREHLNIPQGVYAVLAVGAFTHRKGHDHLIQAIGLLAERKEEVHLLLCGADDSAWLQKMADDLGVADRVHFFRSLSEEDLRLLFKAADMYADASNTPRACLGIALTEALATGIPAIAYDVAGLPEVVKDQETGYLVPVDDISALADTIGKLHKASPEEQSRLGQNGLKRAREVFDIHGIATLLMNELHSVHERQKGPG
jgi:glycosyltransferase involved in cell wall biosynthesis